MKKLLFLILCLLSLLIGAYPLIYVFVEHKNTFLSLKSPEVLDNIIWKSAFFAHIIFGGLSLFIGWRQFGSNFRNNYLRLHKIIGKTYVTAVAISSISSLYMGFHANGGIISSIGFILLGLIWLSTTFIAVQEIRKQNILNHQLLMTYSYSCTFAAVTLRIWFIILVKITKDPSNSYIAVAWLCWVPNLLVAYLINRKTIMKDNSELNL